MPGHPGRKTADLPENPGLPYQADRRPVKVLDREVDLAPVMPARGRGSHTPHNRKGTHIHRADRPAQRTHVVLRLCACEPRPRSGIGASRSLGMRDATGRQFAAVAPRSAGRRRKARPFHRVASVGEVRRPGLDVHRREDAVSSRGCEYIPSTSQHWGGLF